jgi:hypothetical protein
VSGQAGPDEPELDAAAIVGALNRHQVRYVVIGAFAAIAQQAPIPAPEHLPYHGRRLAALMDGIPASADRWRYRAR